MQRLNHGQDFANTSAQKMFGDVTVVRCGYSRAARTPRHLHDRPYFGVVLAGRFEETYATRTIGANRDEVAFHPAGEDHATSVFAGLRIIRIELGSRFAAGDTASLLERAPTVLPCRGGDFIRRLVSECRSPDALTPLVFESVALELIARLGRSPDEDAPAWVARIRNRLREEYAHAHTLADLARDSGVHPGHVARAFRRHYGATVGDVIRAERIAFARRALASTDQPLADIALAAGFASQSHFSTSFRRATGESPAAYRRSRQARTKMQRR
ncbi:MAG TPA: AraC family transcriptional regulator [Thermoanaerobaculia bacterium]|nr:AraC family transcriptional regulator [Thermoanaerobaculia bacterium]